MTIYLPSIFATTTDTIAIETTDTAGICLIGQRVSREDTQLFDSIKRTPSKLLDLAATHYFGDVDVYELAAFNRREIKNPSCSRWPIDDALDIFFKNFLPSKAQVINLFGREYEGKVYLGSKLYKAFSHGAQREKDDQAKVLLLVTEWNRLAEMDQRMERAEMPPYIQR